MVREETLITLLRFYEHDTDDPLAKYTASCTLLWESKDTVWIKGLAGDFSRKALRDLIQYIFDKNILWVKSHRSSGGLPFATRTDGSYCEVDINLVRDRLKKFLA